MYGMKMQMKDLKKSIGKKNYGGKKKSMASCSHGGKKKYSTPKMGKKGMR